LHQSITSINRYFQIGKVVDGPADFYAGDNTRGKGKATLADELLSDVAFRKYHKAKFNEIQKKRARDGVTKKKKKKGRKHVGKTRH